MVITMREGSKMEKLMVWGFFRYITGSDMKDNLSKMISLWEKEYQLINCKYMREGSEDTSFKDMEF